MQALNLEAIDRTDPTDRLVEWQGYRDCVQDCFACLQSECYALEWAINPCSFFKTALENHRAVMKCFYKLITAERFDLLYKYREVLECVSKSINPRKS